MAPRNTGRDADDDAPWLAEAAPPPQTRVSRRSLVWTVLIFLTLAAIVAAGTAMLMSKKDTGSTQGYMNAEQAPLILAEPGPYKVKPLDPKGLAVEGQDQTLYAAGEGIDQGSIIDESTVPEALLPRPGSVGPPVDLIPAVDLPPASAPPPVLAPEASGIRSPTPLARPPASPPSVRPQATPPAARPDPVSPPAPALRPAPRTPPGTVPSGAVPSGPVPSGPLPSGIVQLGAFSTAAKAEAAWAALAARHGMPGFTRQLSAIQRDGETLWRLRGQGSDPARLCAKLKSAGDPCTVVN